MVKVNLVLTGREKAYSEAALGECQKIIAKLQEKSPQIKLKDDIKRQGSNYFFFLYKKKQ